MIKADCRHFPGDRPCAFHKDEQVVCADCSMYEPRGTSIVIIKFDALGDVLRTTSILPALRRRYEASQVTWVTSPAARDLFIGNTLVEEVITESSEYIPMLLSREFDVVINPDAAPRSSELASIARAREKFGFTVDRRGCVVPLNEAAMSWFEMGGLDHLKRSNKRTYQEMLHDICELDAHGQHIVLHLTDCERRRRVELARVIGVDAAKPVIGLNTGAGGRWKHKKWRIDGFVQLIEMILSGTDARVILLGGESEAERNASISARFDTRVYNPGPGSLREFIRTVDLCDVVVTGDTLAVHVTVGLKKRAVVLFGPTSSAEIDLYDRGAKIVPAIDCVCCYRSDCDRLPSCMDLISAAEVYHSVIEQLSLAMDDREQAFRQRMRDIQRMRETDEAMVGGPGR